jgi:DNA-binding transcriptional ArsR family regulator
MMGDTRTQLDAEDPIPGDPDVAQVGALLSDPSRCRILFALMDGRALPASVLAAEAGVAASTASAHLHRLTESGMLRVVRQGRWRYYQLGGPEVAEVIEALSRIAPQRPVRSLRAGTRANKMRTARTCYDHLAGRLGVTLMRAMVSQGYLAGHDGSFDPATADADHLSGRGRDHVYLLTEKGESFLADFLAGCPTPLPQDMVVRYCVDWTEQRHHLAGALGRSLFGRMLELEWVRKPSAGRWLQVTDSGKGGLADSFGLQPEEWLA